MFIQLLNHSFPSSVVSSTNFINMLFLFALVANGRGSVKNYLLPDQRLLLRAAKMMFVACCLSKSGPSQLDSSQAELIKRLMLLPLFCRRLRRSSFSPATSVWNSSNKQCNLVSVFNFGKYLCNNNLFKIF
jgi:hypothetical protein